MKLKDNKDIIVYKDKESNVKFTIEAPFMYDSKLEFSDKIEMKLTKEGAKYVLTLVPDKEWLESEERTYPITIDPTIQTSLYVEDIDDTFIYKGDTNNKTRHNAHILRVGNGKFLSGNPLRSLIKFSLPTLKSGDQVIAAELSLRNYPETQEWNPPTEERTFCVHKVTASWTGSSANWSNISSKYDSKVVDFIKYKYSTSDTRKDNRFDITSIVKDWYINGKNYGVMIKEEKEANATTGTDAYFYSANTSGTYTNYRPKIIIAYRNQTGLEDYLSYHCQSADRTNVYTNDYNGNLTMVYDSISTSGNKLPATIELIYNTNDKDVDIGYGKGIRLNLSQTLEAQTISGTEYLKYIDEDATTHYFEKKANTNTYEDEDGLGLNITASGTDRIMTDKSGNTMKFVKHSSGNRWHLKEIKDTNNNMVSLTLSSATSQYIITKVTDAAGDILTLRYFDGAPYEIESNDGKMLAFAYNNGLLIMVGHLDGRTTEYEYGGKNELIKVKDLDGSYLAYTYYSGSVYRVKSITEYGSSGTVGNSMTITYGHNLTKFTDNQGYSNTYTFDNNGHCISISDFGKEGENINNAYGKAYDYGTSGGINNKLTLEGNLVSVKDLEDNLLENANFDDGNNNWQKSSCSTNDKVVSLNGNNMFKITGEIAKKKHIKQVIDISGKKGDIFTFYGWAKSLGVPNRSGSTTYAGITIGLTKQDGTVQWQDKEAISGTDAWQFVSTQFIAKEDYKNVMVYLKVYQNANDVYFDNVGLFKEEYGTSYTYDSKGNIISCKDLANQNSTFQYDGDNNLIKSVNPKGGKFTYEYDKAIKGRLLNATNNFGNKYSLEYDAYGNVTNVKVENPTKTTKYIENKATYTEDGNYTTDIENELGEKTTYTYNKGLISSVINPKGSKVDYTYDNIGRTLSSKMTDGNKTYQNTYTYENDKLKTIGHNGMNYNFTYDEYGNTKKVAIGNNELISHTYNSNNGTLLSSNYGNGNSIQYTYDRFNRLIKEQTNSGKTTEYTYDGRGNLEKIFNNGSEYPTATFKYDMSGRMTEKHSVQDEFDEEYQYDENGNIKKIQSYIFIGGNRGKYNPYINYTYDLDNSITEINMPAHNLVYNYDGLQRINNRKFSKSYGGEELSYNVNYTYKDLEGNKTTTQIKSMQNGNDATLNYTYDKNGNIETISKGSELKQKYYYDGLNQLIREDDKEQNRTYTYEYDVGGNILNKKEYLYTESEDLPQATKTISYSYGNNNWKDQLTSYDNQSITYDEIGNPTSYNGNTYTWTRGRMLQSIKNEVTGLNVEYKYDHNGMRTEKYANGNMHTYSIRDDKIVFEMKNARVYYYSYDENGQPIGISYLNTMTYDGADYVYKKNLQGDIIGILDSNLNEVVKYTYDSWGKVLSVTDAEGKEVTDEYNIGLVNPFRYKGYYYDYETGYYYLKTRYYNPEWGRFLNADGLFESGHEVLGNNLYTYCSNNPINYCDPDGQLLATLTSVFLTIAGKVAIATGIIVGGTIVTVGVVATVDAIAKATTSNSKRNTTKQDNKTNTKSNKKKSKKSGKKK